MLRHLKEDSMYFGFSLKNKNKKHTSHWLAPPLLGNTINGVVLTNKANIQTRKM